MPRAPRRDGFSMMLTGANVGMAALLKGRIRHCSRQSMRCWEGLQWYGLSGWGLGAVRSKREQ